MPATGTDLIQDCGCEIRNAAGQLDVNAMRAVAYEANLIQNTGFQALKEVDTMLNDLVPTKPGNPDEAESPRDEVEYRFGLPDTNLAASDFLASGSASEEMTIQTSEGTQTITAVQKNLGSPGCGNRSVQLIGGRDDRTGYYRQLPDVESPCICVLDYARTKDFPAVLRAIRTAMPEEMAYVKERVLLRELLSLSWANTSESGAEEPLFTRGYFPHEPVAGANLHTFLKLRDRLKRQGHKGMVEVPISLQSLRAMMIHYYQQFGDRFQMQVSAWGMGQFPLTRRNDGEVTYVHEGSLEFCVKDTPILGTFEQVATNRVEFVPISPRKWRAGTGAGAIYDYNEDYDKPVIVRNGAEKNVYELIPIISQQAFTQHPFVMRNLGVENVDTNQMMWSGTNVRVISGAFIPNNEKFLRFYLQLSHVFKLVARKPYLAGFVAIRKADYPRSANLIGLTADQAAESTRHYIGGGRQADATSPGDVKAGLSPIDPAPSALTDCCVETVSGAGNLRANCALVVGPNESTIVVTVERINGVSGAASVAYAINDGTGVAGTDYTDASGTLSWADGVYGPKTLTITIPNTARHGRTFSVAWSSFTGATNVTNGCTTTSITIHRPAKSYVLGEGLTGSLTNITANGSALGLGTFAATAAGALALQDALNDVLGGDGVASVTFGTDWNIRITDTHTVFTSATNGTDTVTFSEV